MTLSVMVPTKPGGDIGVCLCELCDKDKVEYMWVDLW